MAVNQDELNWWLQHGKIWTEDGGAVAFLSLHESLAYVAELPPLSFDTLMEYLRKLNVTQGIDLVACQQVVMNPRNFIGTKQKIAEGRAPIHGENAVIEILVTQQEARGPRVLDDGRVDYFNLGSVKNVQRGQVLAVKKPATEGVPGMSVNGAPIIAKPGKDLRLPVGKNTSVSPDGLQLVAEVDGHFSYNPREGKINVFNVYEVKGDVDFSVGNIDFLGSVRVNGSVLPGFKIVAAGDIEVMGLVDGAVLEAGGEIIIRGGVQMRSTGLIKAGGSVRSRFLQGAHVEAGVDVIIRDSIMHCHISAGNNVLMESQKSVIVGGVVRAGHEVRSRNIGSPMATPTEIEVGVHPHLRQEMQELHQKLKDLHQNMDKTKKALNLLEQMISHGKALPPEKESLHKNLTHTYEHYLQEEEEIMLRRSEIESILLDTANAKVYVQDVLYSGVKLTLGQQIAYIRDIQKGPLVYQISEGEITRSRF
jgi:uncharacterized protein (DUF342 family)